MVRADYAVGVKGVGFDQQKKLALQRHEFERKRNSIGDIAEDSAAWDNAEVIAQAALLEQAAAPAILGSTVNYGDQLSTPRSPIAESYGNEFKSLFGSSPAVEAPDAPQMGGVDMWASDGLTDNTRSELLQARIRAASVLFKMYLRPEDLGNFAVAFMPMGPGGQEAFQIDAQGGDVMFRATSPESVTAALAWYCMTYCSTTLADAMSRGLPNPLPSTEKPVLCVQVKTSGSKQAWQVVDSLGWEAAGVDGSAAGSFNVPSSYGTAPGAHRRQSELTGGLDVQMPGFMGIFSPTGMVEDDEETFMLDQTKVATLVNSGQLNGISADLRALVDTLIADMERVFTMGEMLRLSFALEGAFSAAGLGGGLGAGATPQVQPRQAAAQVQAETLQQQQAQAKLDAETAAQEAELIALQTQLRQQTDEQARLLEQERAALAQEMQEMQQQMLNAQAQQEDEQKRILADAEAEWQQLNAAQAPPPLPTPNPVPGRQQQAAFQNPAFVGGNGLPDMSPYGTRPEEAQAKQAHLDHMRRLADQEKANAAALRNQLTMEKQRLEQERLAQRALHEQMMRDQAALAAEEQRAAEGQRQALLEAEAQRQRVAQERAQLVEITRQARLKAEQQRYKVAEDRMAMQIQAQQAQQQAMAARLQRERGLIQQQRLQLERERTKKLEAMNRARASQQQSAQMMQGLRTAGAARSKEAQAAAQRIQSEYGNLGAAGAGLPQMPQMPAMGAMPQMPGPIAEAGANPYGQLTAAQIQMMRAQMQQTQRANAIAVAAQMRDASSAANTVAANNAAGLYRFALRLDQDFATRKAPQEYQAMLNAVLPDTPTVVSVTAPSVILGVHGSSSCAEAAKKLQRSGTWTVGGAKVMAMSVPQPVPSGQLQKPRPPPLNMGAGPAAAGMPTSPEDRAKVQAELARLGFAKQTPLKSAMKSSTSSLASPTGSPDGPAPPSAKKISFTDPSTSGGLPSEFTGGDRRESVASDFGPLKKYLKEVFQSMGSDVVDLVEKEVLISKVDKAAMAAMLESEGAASFVYAGVADEDKDEEGDVLVGKLLESLQASPIGEVNFSTWLEAFLPDNIIATRNDMAKPRASMVNFSDNLMSRMAPSRGGGGDGIAEEDEEDYDNQDYLGTGAPAKRKLSEDVGGFDGLSMGSFDSSASGASNANAKDAEARELADQRAAAAMARDMGMRPSMAEGMSGLEVVDRAIDEAEQRARAAADGGSNSSFGSSSSGDSDADGAAEEAPRPVTPRTRKRVQDELAALGFMKQAPQPDDDDTTALSRAMEGGQPTPLVSNPANATALEAIADYTPMSDTELGLNKGDYIIILQKEDEPFASDTAWLFGTVGGRRGYFPARMAGPVSTYGAADAGGGGADIEALRELRHNAEDAERAAAFNKHEVRRPARIASYGRDPAAIGPNSIIAGIPSMARKGALPHETDGNDDLESVFFDDHADNEPSPQEIAQHSVLDPEEEVIWRYLLMDRRTKMHLHNDLKAHDAAYHGTWDWLRYVCYNAVHDWKFEVFFLLIIGCNVVTLALYNPLEPSGSGRNYYLQFIEFAFLGLYWIEVVVRSLADGFWYPKNTTQKAYISDSSNILDLFIVLSGTVEFALFFTSIEGSAGVTALRALRALRAVKFIKQFDSLRLVINVIFSALPPLASVMVVCLVIVVIYIVLGMQLYSGALRRACYWDANLTQVEVRACGTASSAWQCAANQTCYSWTDVPADGSMLSPVPPFQGVWSFDNAGLAFYTVFAIITLEGWTDIMYALNDALGAAGNWLYFVTLVLVGGYFIISMVIGVLAGLYMKEATLGVRQKVKAVERAKSKGTWVEKPKKVEPEPLLPSLVPYVNGAWFSGFIILTIVVNAGFLAVDHAHQSDAISQTLAFGNYIFVGIFVFELVLKLLVLGPKLYVFDGFNIFDGVITILSIIELLITEVPALYVEGDMAIRVFRSLRLFRILRVATSSDKLRQYSAGAVNALNGLGALLGLILLYLIVVALIGMQLFGGNTNWENPRTHYDTFGDAMITSFQIQTCEGWNQVLYDAVIAWGGASSPGALIGIFFVVMVMFGHFVLFGVLLAIAYQNLEEMAPKREVKDLSAEAIANKDYLQLEDKSMVEGNAFFCISPTNGIRDFCHRVMHHSKFDPFILVCILISSILLGVEDQVNPNNKRNDVLFNFDIIFTVIFTLEMLIKMTALGVVFHKRSYLRDGWNVLDFVVVGASIASVALKFTLPNVNIGGIRVIRTLRVLRPLRAVKRSPGMKKVVGAMLDSVSEISGLLAAAGMILFCFAVMGVSFYKEQMNYCNDIDMPNMTSCVGNYSYAIDSMTKLRYSANQVEATLDAGLYNETENYNYYFEAREWDLPYLNFEYSYKGAEALLSIIGFEDWTRLYYQSADTVGVNQSPSINNRKAHIFFYIAYLVAVALFFINIVMAFVVLTYQNQADELKNRTGLSKTQVSCLRFALNVKQPHDKFRHRRKKRFLPDHKGSEWMVDMGGIPVRGKYVVEKNLLWFIDHGYFEGAMLALVLLNVVTLLMAYYNQSAEYTAALDMANYVFVGLFVLEAMVKILVLGSKAYFTDNWNLADFVIVVGSLIDICVADYIKITFLRVFRVARLVKFFHSGSLRNLFITCVKSMQSVPFVLLVMCLVFYIWAIVGMLLFARIPLDLNPGISEHNHFQDLPNALMVLFRTMTGEAWQLILEATYIKDGEALGLCINNPPADAGNVSCGSPVNVFYFLSFVLFTTLLVVNVLIAVIVDNFEYLYVDKSELQVHHLQAFVDQWCLLDPAGTGKIHHTWLIPLLKAVEPPLGLGKKCPAFVAHRMMSRAPIPLDEHGFVSFRASLVGLIRCRMNMWLFDFPAHEDLVGIMRYVAPAASEKSIMEGAPVSEGIQLRFLYTVQRLQHIYRLNRRAAHVRERVGRLERNMLAAQQGYELRVAQIASPMDHHTQNAESQMLAKYKDGVQQRIHALKTAIKPGAILAFELTKSHLEQTQRAIASKGKRDSLRPQWLALTGKVKRTKPTTEQMMRYNDIDPKTTRPLRSSKVQGWQPARQKGGPSKRASMSAAEAGTSVNVLHPAIAARAGVPMPMPMPQQRGNGTGMYRDPVPVSLANVGRANEFRAFAMPPGASINPMLAADSMPMPGMASGPAAAAAYRALAQGQVGVGPWQGGAAADMFRQTASQQQPAAMRQQQMMQGAGLQALVNAQGGGLGGQPAGPSTRMFREDAWQQQAQNPYGGVSNFAGAPSN